MATSFNPLSRLMCLQQQRRLPSLRRRLLGFQSPFEADVFATQPRRRGTVIRTFCFNPLSRLMCLQRKEEKRGRGPLVEFQSPFEADVFATRRGPSQDPGPSSVFQSPFEADVFATGPSTHTTQQMRAGFNPLSRLMCLQQTPFSRPSQTGFLGHESDIAP